MGRRGEGATQEAATAPGSEDDAEHWFLPHRWAVTVEPDCTTVFDLVLGDRIRLRGALARDLLGAPELWLRRFEAYPVVEPSLRAFAASLREHSPTKWSRAALMRGGGYEQLFIELTSRCNERCVHCYAESTPERTEELPARAVAEVIDAGARLGFRTVQLTGGDPLIADAFLDAAARATDRRYETVEVYTNGVALNEERFERLRALGVHFAFSFYSHRPEAHDAITRLPGSWQRTLRAIERCVEADRRVRVSIVCLESNRDDLEATISLLESIGVPRHAIGHDRVRTVGRGLEAPMADVDDVVGYRANHRAGPLDDMAPEEFSFGGRIAVRPDGAVVPCIFAREQILGNVLDSPLDVILGEAVAIAPPAALSNEASAQIAESLACLECRVRSTLLAKPPAALVQLRAVPA